MGLIQQAESRQTRGEPQSDPVSKKKTGLLGKIYQASGFDALSSGFSAFVSGVRAERVCVLYPSESRQYACFLNAGFDHTTVHRICPDVSSFDEKFPDPLNWYLFENSASLEEVRPFFSSREFDSLTGLRIRCVPLQGVRAYVVIAESKLDINRDRQSLSDPDKFDAFARVLERWQSMLPSLTRTGSLRISNDTMRQRAKSALDSGKVATLVTISFGELFNSPESVYTDTDTEILFGTMYHRIAQRAGKSNLVTSLPDLTLRIVLFASMPIDSGMYFSQLMKPLELLFGAWRMSRAIVTPVGSTLSLADILHFLRGES